MSPLLPVADALQRMLAEASTVVARESCPLAAALGRTLAEDVAAAIDVPGADNSAMDGYALRAGDAPGPLRVSQRIAAGAVGDALGPGTAARIFTGAPIPAGADAVVMQEDCQRVDDQLTIQNAVAVGDHIRPRGQDIAAGSELLRAGRILRAQDLGLLASIGCDRVAVYRPLRVAVLATGDELVEPGAGELLPGQLFNSNRYTLGGLVRGLGMEVIDGEVVPDDPEATAAALRRGAASADCVITCGGVSVGEEDHVKAQVERLGALLLWRLAIKPGKPLAFGRIGDTPFIGLPGNPSSAFVTFCLLARPYLRRLQGVHEPEPPQLYARAGFSARQPGTRQEYLRVTVSNVDGELLARSYPNQSSGVLSSVSHSNALAIVPPGVVVQEGDKLAVILLDSLV